ncbi:MAG: helix-turn-helix domain-containing protein [Rhizomicrobium sp.]
MSEHYLEQPRLEDAAESVGLSPFHFQRLFTRYVGVSPKSFVGHLTLDHAKLELAHGQSVLGAALDAGLSGPSRLHDLSLKIEAMTPGDYARGGEGVVIDYGFADCPFGVALIMATEKRRVRTRLRRRTRRRRDDGRHARTLAARDLSRKQEPRRQDRAPNLRNRGWRPPAASDRHAMADQGVAGAARNPRPARSRPTAPSRRKFTAQRRAAQSALLSDAIRSPG